MDLGMEFGLMAILKMINGSDHDFEGIMILRAKWLEELKMKNKYWVQGTWKPCVKLVGISYGPWFSTNFSRFMNNQGTKFDLIIILYLLERMNSSGRKNGSHKSPKLYIKKSKLSYKHLKIHDESTAEI